MTNSLVNRMKHTINLVQFGLGSVGIKLLDLVDNLNKERDDIEIKYIAIAEKDGGVINTDGIEIEKILVAGKKSVLNQFDGYEQWLNGKKLIDKLAHQNIRNCVVLDVTAAEDMGAILKQALCSGYHAILSNKKPLSGNFEDFDELQKAGRAGKAKLLFECTVGAGLPIIYTLQSLIATGDKIIDINGCFSGTLGYIFSELEKGRKFSDVVVEAKQLGYTEPDPRDDLSGFDVARKAIILSRLCGNKTELSDLYIENILPENMEDLSVDNFLAELSNYDALFAGKYKNASKRGNTLRYVASVASGKVDIGLKEVPLNSPVGSLKGPLNICVIHSKRYDSYPLVIQGPGAGKDVTADGVLRNILECID